MLHQTVTVFTVRAVTIKSPPTFRVSQNYSCPVRSFFFSIFFLFYPWIRRRRTHPSLQRETWQVTRCPYTIDCKQGVRVKHISRRSVDGEARAVQLGVNWRGTTRLSLQHVVRFLLCFCFWWWWFFTTPIYVEARPACFELQHAPHQKRCKHFQVVNLL